MNFLTLQLGVAFSLLVLIGNCGQTYAAPKPCKGGCSGTSGYNSGYTANTPAVLSPPLGHSVAGNHGTHGVYSGGHSGTLPTSSLDTVGVHSGSNGADIIGNNDILQRMLTLLKISAL